MGIAKVHCRAQVGIEAPLVEVEVHVSGGLPSFALVGLPETAVRESRDRVRAAIVNAQLEFPRSRILVSLAPADLPKEGGRYDLAIALGLLIASGQFPEEQAQDTVFIGELGLSGELRPVRGVLPTAMACARYRQRLILPRDNADEAMRIPDARLCAAANLLEVCAFLKDPARLPPLPDNGADPAAPSYPDLADVRGQHRARRALEVAAAGGHNLLLYGPPGTGKSMLAERLPGILPPMNIDEAMQSALVFSVSPEGWDARRFGERPFRAVHHGTSAVALIGGAGGRGGSTHLTPGEISLASHGVLYLDELPEFPRHVLDALRQPLEMGEIAITRAVGRAVFPAQFQLIAAMNPCPCGYFSAEQPDCRCSPAQIERYQARISGPLLDRIDLQIGLARVPARTLSTLKPGEASAQVAARVAKARARQHSRQGCPNARLADAELSKRAALGGSEQALLDAAVDQLELSARALRRIQRVARTIADLEGAARIGAVHLSEAIQYRRGLPRV